MFKRTLSVLAISTLPILTLAVDREHQHNHHDHHAWTPSFYGQAGKLEQVSRTIEIDMSDSMRFTPSEIDVKSGETVRFVISNSGQLPHEMVIGSMEELKAHAAEMLEMPDMEHEDPNMISVEPGQSGELIWQFDQAAEVDFACLIPGHTEAGMVGKIYVK